MNGDGLTAFVRRALIEPVQWEPPPDPARRRRPVVAVTLVVGAIVLAATLQIEPGDSTFYAGTAALAAVWTVGAWASGPLHLGRALSRAGTVVRPTVTALILGAVLLGLFLLGGVVIAPIDALRDPVEELLDHARLGSLPVIVAITAWSGVAEELYFRGALYTAVGRRHAVAITTVVYTLTTIGTGIPLLVFAAAALGLLTGLQRRVTGGVLAPIITHLTWSLGMLLLLPGALSIGA